MPFTEPKAEKIDYGTPWPIFNDLKKEFPFSLDVCAQPHNAKCERYFTPEQDGLKQHWSGICWMNPPYGKDIGEWIKKAFHSALEGDATVVCLLPARSNNEWWKYVIHGEVRFIRKKLQFEGSEGVSMFASVIVIFHAYLDPGGIMRVYHMPDVAKRKTLGTRRSSESVAERVNHYTIAGSNPAIGHPE